MPLYLWPRDPEILHLISLNQDFDPTLSASQTIRPSESEGLMVQGYEATQIIIPKTQMCEMSH